MTVFDYDDYKIYLRDCLPTAGDQRGKRAKLAKALRCQSAYVSQVLRGNGHFSLEHAVLVSEFLGLTGDEDEYFLLLVHLARAGSKKLAAGYKRQMQRLAQRHRRVDAHIRPADAVGDAAQALYYSSWHYAAAHVLLMIPRYRSAESLAAALGLPVPAVEATLHTLQGAGLVSTDGRQAALPARWHLGADSPWIKQHHTNWRLQAVRALDRSAGEQLHYSGPMVLAKGSVAPLRALLLETIERMEPLIAAPGEDEGHAVCLDFFRLDPC